MKDNLFDELVDGFEQAIAMQRGTHANPENITIHTPRRVDGSGLHGRRLQGLSIQTAPVSPRGRWQPKKSKPD